MEGSGREEGIQNTTYFHINNLQMVEIHVHVRMSPKLKTNRMQTLYNNIDS